MSDVFIGDDENKRIENDHIVDTSKSSIQDGGFFDSINQFILSLQKVKTREKVIFYRLLSTMTNSGMSLLKSVMVLEKQEKNLVFKQILGRLCEELRSGETLSASLALYPYSFSESEIGIIQSGEKTGQLNGALKDLADQIEKIESVSGKIKGAMIYPFFILVVVIGVVSVMMLMVVPKLLEIFENKNDLPLSTQLLISFSNWFGNYWYIGLFLIIILYVGISVWKRTPNGLYIFDNILLKIPVLGEINKKLTLSKFSRIFSGLLGSGVSVVESLRVTATAVGNEVYKQRILLLMEDVQKGIKIWESLEGDRLFPNMMIEMIQVGEDTAKLDQTITKVADFYDEEVDNTIATLNKLLEPFIIIFLAVIVGFIAMAIMQPIMNLADTISEG